ncbi:retrovirus-related Pol polyprotein from transposon opus [Trichonephila clavipes]|nr:retrovirus-related Pol polyprotein from transposon opus [Trichonephila clavipes]
MDDVIASSPSFTHHVEHLREFFRLLQDAELTLNKEKCKFDCDELKYLGLIISKKGIQTDETKVRAVVEMKPPRNSKELFTDASSIGVGVVLNQEQRPVVFASRTLSSVERNYTATKRECLAVVWTLKNKFRTHLGSLPIKVITDHAALTRLTNGKNLSSRMIRLVLKLAEFNIEWEHRLGTQNAVADVLSRKPFECIIGEKVNCAIIRDLVLSSREELIEEQRKDPVLRHIYRYLENPEDSSVNVTICENWSSDFCLIESLLFYPKYATSLADRLIPIISNYPNEIVTLDLLGPYPVLRVRRNRYVSVITDLFSKRAEIVPIKKASARVIADTLFDNYISRFGAPVKLISDNGPQFIFDIFEHLSNRLVIRHVKTVVYRPQENRTERFLREFVYAIPTAVNETTGKPPAELVLGRKLITPFQKLVMVSDGIDFAVEDIERLFDEARRSTKAKHENWAKYYDRRKRCAN